MESLNVLGTRAKIASKELARLSQTEKNNALEKVADRLIAETSFLLTENQKDIANAHKNNMKPALVDRLLLTEDRIAAMGEGILEVAALSDPIGEVMGTKIRPNGLMIGKKRVPLGVVGIIYESRPNVTSDAFGLCFKTGNATILRGGSDAINSNMAIVKAIRMGLSDAGITPEALQFVDDTSREIATQMMRLNDYIDVLIPRGGSGLISNVVQNSTVPVIETGIGNCHVFVDESADINMAVEIIDNAKTQRLGVCNACESLVIHRNIAKEAIPPICKRLEEKGIEIRGDEDARAIWPSMNPATQEDFKTEYLDAIISVKVVSDIEEAIEHINACNTGHSDAIVTKDYDNANRFQNEIDAAAVYVNASTRFTDGFEFGFGAEIGISTQKLHARGPMGLEALTTYKYIISGNGQVRP